MMPPVIGTIERVEANGSGRNSGEILIRLCQIKLIKASGCLCTNLERSFSNCFKQFSRQCGMVTPLESHRSQRLAATMR